MPGKVRQGQLRQVSDCLDDRIENHATRQAQAVVWGCRPLPEHSHLELIKGPRRECRSRVTVAIRRFSAVTLMLVVMVAARPALSDPSPHQPDSLDPSCGIV